MNLALAKNETGRALSDSFAVARDRLPGTGKVAEARRAAFEAYERVGLPHRRLEDWKYTDLRALMREVLPLAPAPDAAALKRAAAAVKLQAVKGARRLVLVDGVFAPKLSELDGLEKGLAVRTLRDVLEAGDAALQAQLLRARQRQSDGGAQQRDDDRRRGDRDRQRRRADAAAAYHSCCQRRRARGDVYALDAPPRQGCRRDAGRELHRGRGREGLSGP